jgi:hypothetical protein
MADRHPGEPADQGARGAGRRLAEPPSARYAGAGLEPSDAARRASIAGPLGKAAVVAIGGAATLVIVGAILASTAGLLFVSGLTGAGIGLVLARARVPDGALAPAASHRAVTWLAIGLSAAAVVAAGLGTWLIAVQEGGTLGPIDYLLTTFGPFVPGELLVAAVTAWWGVGAGPVQR